MSNAGILKTCGATKRQGDKSPCMKPAGWGTSHVGFGTCKLHGGSTPASSKHAERERATWERFLIEQIDPSLAALAGIRDGGRLDRDRIAAARDLLDRAGVRVEDHGGRMTVTWEVVWPE